MVQGWKGLASVLGKTSTLTLQDWPSTLHAIPGLFRFEKVESEYLQKEGTTKSYHPLMCNVWKTQQIQWQCLYYVHASLVHMHSSNYSVENWWLSVAIICNWMSSCILVSTKFPYSSLYTHQTPHAMYMCSTTIKMLPLNLPREPVPLIIAATVAFAFWSSFRELLVACRAMKSFLF